MRTRYSTHTSRKGFTLIELLVVVSIISLLSSVVLVTVDTARQKARFTAVKANVKTLFTEGELYRSDNQTYIETNDADVCGSVGGFITSTKVRDVLDQIETLTGVSRSSTDFYCNVWPTKWSLAVDVSSLTNQDQVLCVSTAGRIEIIGNSNDTPASAFAGNDGCVIPF